MNTQPYENWSAVKRRTKVLGEAQNWRCCYCGVQTRFGTHCEWDAPTCEHVIPLRYGGLRDWGNEVMACNLCNNGRGRMSALRYLKMVEEIGRWKAFKLARKERKRFSQERRRRGSERIPDCACGTPLMPGMATCEQCWDGHSPTHRTLTLTQPRPDSETEGRAAMKRKSSKAPHQGEGGAK